MIVDQRVRMAAAREARGLSALSALSAREKPEATSPGDVSGSSMPQISVYGALRSCAQPLIASSRPSVLPAHRRGHLGAATLSGLIGLSKHASSTCIVTRFTVPHGCGDSADGCHGHWCGRAGAPCCRLAGARAPAGRLTAFPCLTCSPSPPLQAGQIPCPISLGA